MKVFRAAAVAAVSAGLLVIPAVAHAQSGGSPGHGDHGVRVVTKGLDGPRQVNRLGDDRLVVAESDTGKVTAVDPRTGARTTLVRGLFAPQGVAADDGKLFVALGGAPPPSEGPGPRPGQASDALLVYGAHGKLLRSVDLLAYELKHNPDGQQQFVDGQPVDALSNPFAVWADDGRVLVADAGANDVLSIDARTGRVRTFFVPPVVSPREVAACGQVENNPGTVGCDPVPTGITRGRDGLFYVSTLGAEAPGAGRVYVLNSRGHVVRVIKNLDAPTGIAVDDDLGVIVSELLYGAPEGPPPPGFDPSSVGRLVRIDSRDHRSAAGVTMPTGLVFQEDRLYASAWSVASLLGLPAGSGQIDRVAEQAFHRIGA
jgi:hypothetical protein